MGFNDFAHICLEHTWTSPNPAAQKNSFTNRGGSVRGIFQGCLCSWLVDTPAGPILLAIDHFPDV